VNTPKNNGARRKVLETEGSAPTTSATRTPSTTWLTSRSPSWPLLVFGSHADLPRPRTLTYERAEDMAGLGVVARVVANGR
jgi:hypothetical protein